MTLMCSTRRSCWRCVAKEMGRNDGEPVLELAKKEETITCADVIALLHISSTKMSNMVRAALLIRHRRFVSDFIFM